MPETAEVDHRQPNPDSLFVKTNILGDGRSWLELQDMLPHPSTGTSPDLTVVNAARVSFLGHSKGSDQDKKLLMYLLRHKHTSPFEQVEFKFRVRAPVVVWWQWLRHRTWHVNLQSGRYTPFSRDDFYIPAAWRRQSESNKQGSEGVVAEEYNTWLSERLQQLISETYTIYEEALERGVAKEQARLMLPSWGSYYIGVVKVDAWNLMHFMRLRIAADAQWEIRQYANAVHEMFRERMPWTAEAFDRYVNPKQSTN